MKKRANKKLRLNRETLHNLQGEQMRQVAGASNLANSDCCAGTELCTSGVCIAPSVCECASRGGWDCYPPSACFGSCSCG